MPEPIDLFFSYSHKDELLRDELATHLKLLERLSVIRGWHDRRIGAGDDWKPAIDEHLERAGVVLLLVSADFLASDYCYDVEMQRALERRETGDAVIIPVILRPCDWTLAPFAKLQALPRDGKAVTSWSDRDEAWTNVAQGIRAAVQMAPSAARNDAANSKVDAKASSQPPRRQDRSDSKKPLSSVEGFPFLPGMATRPSLQYLPSQPKENGEQVDLDAMAKRVAGVNSPVISRISTPEEVLAFVEHRMLSTNYLKLHTAEHGKDYPPHKAWMAAADLARKKGWRARMQGVEFYMQRGPREPSKSYSQDAQGTPATKLSVEVPRKRGAVLADLLEEEVSCKRDDIPASSGSSSPEATDLSPDGPVDPPTFLGASTPEELLAAVEYDLLTKSEFRCSIALDGRPAKLWKDMIELARAKPGLDGGIIGAHAVVRKRP